MPACMIAMIFCHDIFFYYVSSLPTLHFFNAFVSLQRGDERFALSSLSSLSLTVSSLSYADTLVVRPPFSRLDADALCVR